MYLLLKLAELVIKNIPRKAGYFIFTLFGLFSFYTDKKRRDTLKYNLSTAVGREKATDALLKRVFINYSKYYCDLFMDVNKVLGYIPPKCDEEFRKNTVPIVEHYLGSGRGCIIISMHYGNWDVAGSYGASVFKGKMNVVVERLSEGLFRWFSEKRTRLGMKVIEATDIKSMIRVLKAGEVLVLLGDRDLDRLGYRMEYFGKKAYIPSGPAKLSLMTKAPILVGVARRDENDNFWPMTNVIGINEEGMERNDGNAEKITRQIVSAMEKFVKDDPSQWCMLQQVFVDDNR